MIETSGAEVLANRERLLKALPSGEGLHGIITTDRADGLLYSHDTKIRSGGCRNRRARQTGMTLIEN